MSVFLHLSSLTAAQSYIRAFPNLTAPGTTTYTQLLEHFASPYHRPQSSLNRKVLNLGDVDQTIRTISALCSDALRELAPSHTYWGSAGDLFEKSSFRTAPTDFVSPISQSLYRSELKKEKIQKKILAERQPGGSKAAPSTLLNAHLLITSAINLFADTFSEQIPDCLTFYAVALAHPDFVVNYPESQKHAPQYGTTYFDSEHVAQRPKAEQAHLLKAITSSRALRRVCPDAGAILKEPDSIRGRAASSKLLAALPQLITVENQRDFATALSLLFPSTEMAITERQRINSKVLADMVVRARKSQGGLYDRFLELTVAAKGFTLYSLACLTLYSWSSHNCGKILQTQITHGALSAGMLGYEKCMKELHTLARRGQVVPHSSAPPTPPASSERPYPTSFFYMNVLVGRFYHAPLADDGSVEDRQAYMGEHYATGADGKPSQPLYKEYFSETLTEVTQPAASAWATSAVKSEDDWMLRFLAYGASGSATTAGKADLKMDRSVSKSFWLAAKTAPQIFEKIRTVFPENRTASIVKREAGKIRLLLASSLDAWLIESIVLNEIESTILRSLPEVPLELDAVEEARRISTRFQEVATLSQNCIVDADYADFNITHTLADFAKYFERLADLAHYHIPLGQSFDGREKRDVYRDAALWCRDSLSNLWVRNSTKPGSDHVQLNRGLWSGWRSTQFFNTTMNVIYARIARRSGQLVHGEELLASSENCGDDSHAVANSDSAALSFVASLADQGHELNPAKQIVAGRTSEFLRVTYYATGTAAGALCRSISGFVGSDLQRPVNRAGRDFTAGCWSAGNNLIRRGFNKSTMALILESLTCYWGIAISSTGKKLSFPRQVIHAPTSVGGWGCSLFGDLLAVGTLRFPPHPTFSPAELWTEAPDLPAVSNFVKMFAAFCHSRRFRLHKPELIQKALLDAVTTNQNYDFLPKSVYEYYNDMVYSYAVECIAFTKQHHAKEFRYDIPLNTNPDVEQRIATVLDNIVNPLFPAANSPEDYAETVRAAALGLFSAANTKAFSSIRPLDVSKYVDTAKLLSLMDASVTDKQVTAMLAIVPIGLFVPILSYKFHVPGEATGLIPSELRGRLSSVINYSMSLIPSMSREMHGLTELHEGYGALYYTYNERQLDQIRNYLVGVVNSFSLEYQKRKLHKRFMW